MGLSSFVLHVKRCHDGSLTRGPLDRSLARRRRRSSNKNVGKWLIKVGTELNR